MEWKSQLQKFKWLYRGVKYQMIENFISTEIIEKLIEEIPEEAMINYETRIESGKELKQRLRVKWL